jgi:hypothetical protein
MARGLGRVLVAKVDQSGKKIKGKLATWIKNHPGEMYFDSTPEWEVWDYMTTKSITHIYEKELVLCPGCNTIEFKAGKLVKTKQREIKYTPDYYLPEYDTYIEVKGYLDELFRVRWKLFKLKGYTGYLVYSLKDFIAVLKLLESTN